MSLNTKFLGSMLLAFLIEFPIYVWLHPPWYAMFSIGLAAYCVARGSMCDAPSR